MTADSTPEQAPPQSLWVTAFWCCFYGTGIIAMLLIYGLLQERIMGEPYGNDYFGVSVFLVWCNRMVAVIYAIVMIFVKSESMRNSAPLWKYLAVSLSNVGASWCQYEALRYVAFPVQMLGKSFKMMPVMVWGMIISGKRYGLSDWGVAAAVTGGVTEFLLTGTIAAKHQHGTSVHGLILLLIFLGLDGFTSTFQEKLFKEHPVSKYNQMLYINIISAIITLVAMIATHTVSSAHVFCSVHPAIVVDIIELCLASIVGQWFIYSLVKEFGAFVLATTLAVRQVVSTLISYIYYRHPITHLQVVALVLVFGALLLKTFLRLRNLTEKSLEKRRLMHADPEAKEWKAAQGQQARV
mmetsp:Transcript_108913/g.351582  ORF Transcript_108913/g.351582 Transcript_108913/m.351582 type:complete len:353 (+) Transcript_108913:50-1108(+)